MRYVRIYDATAADAEHLIAELWCALELYDIPSPRLGVESAPGDRMDVTIAFRHASDAALVLRALRASIERLGVTAAFDEPFRLAAVVVPPLIHHATRH